MKRLFTSCFGLGWLPLAPGTWASVPPAIIYGLLSFSSASTITISVLMLCLVVSGSIVCIKFAPAVIAATGRNDPREIVVDELAGQSLTFLIIGTVPENRICITIIIGFLLFRLFDIFKPWPVRKFERLPEGWGILTDDLSAGIYAGILSFVCLKTGFVDSVGELLRFNGLSLNILSAALLGAIQGLTEFLPVSSSGHLVLFENFFHLNPERPEMLLFDLAVHVATVVSIFIVFRKSITAFIRNLISSGKYGTSAVQIYKKSPSVHLLVLAITATFVTGVLGILFEKYFKVARGKLGTVAAMWLITGTLLLITDCRKKTRLGLRQFGITAAILVGIAQAIAIMPGVSRSGATICAAILIGLHRRWAVEFSFLIAIPAILGATIIELAGTFEKISPETLPVTSILAGCAAAILVGIFALKILIITSRTAKFRFFAFYCYFLAIFVTVYLLC